MPWAVIAGIFDLVLIHWAFKFSRQVFLIQGIFDYKCEVFISPSAFHDLKAPECTGNFFPSKIALPLHIQLPGVDDKKMKPKAPLHLQRKSILLNSE